MKTLISGLQPSGLLLKAVRKCDDIEILAQSLTDEQNADTPRKVILDAITLRIDEIRNGISASNAEKPLAAAPVKAVPKPGKKASKAKKQAKAEPVIEPEPNEEPLPIEAGEEAVEPVAEQPATEQPMIEPVAAKPQKRKRGRPSKADLAARAELPTPEPTPKRGPGRPRKVQTEQPISTEPPKPAEPPKPRTPADNCATVLFSALGTGDASLVAVMIGQIRAEANGTDEEMAVAMIGAFGALHATRTRGTPRTPRTPGSRRPGHDEGSPVRTASPRDVARIRQAVAKGTTSADGSVIVSEAVMADCFPATWRNYKFVWGGISSSAACGTVAARDAGYNVSFDAKKPELILRPIT